MRLDVYASLTHYRDHLRAVWEACGAEGTWWSHFGDDETEMIPDRWPDPAVPVLVASFADALKVRGRPIIHVEHGAGQTYAGDPDGAHHPSYAGGMNMPEGVILYLTPAERGAARWRDRYPTVPAVAVGCPKLDPWHKGRNSFPGEVTSRGPVVAFTFHWDCRLVPETRTALWHYDDHLADIVTVLRALGFGVLGTEHPRWGGRLLNRWAELGVPCTADWHQVFALADVLVADNTSLLYEFASLDKPVVCLNAPWYRRSVEHGLRFWSAVPGEQVDNPVEVMSAVERAHDDHAPLRAMRHRAVAAAYKYTDGKAAERAAAAISMVVP